MPSDRTITATMLRDIVVCERRAHHDLHTDPDGRDPVSSFVEMLWAGGSAHERVVLGDLSGRIVDLREMSVPARPEATRAALRGEADHVLGAVLLDQDLEGRPDIISRIDGEWVCGDVKSGTPFMPDGHRVRHEYGAQIGLYARLLGALDLGAAGRAFVIGSDGMRTVFDLTTSWGGSTMSAMVDALVDKARLIRDALQATRGEASAKCGMCHWRSTCRDELTAADDLTLIAELGRKGRGAIEPFAPTRVALATLDVASLSRPGGRTAVPGIGTARLARFRDRALLQTSPDPKPYARAPLGLARAATEWHLDIEADPTSNDFVYLHGIWERRRAVDGGENAAFVYFFADDEQEERAAFAATWAFLHSDPHAQIYYYSPYERVSYRRLQRRYPDVCTAADVDAFFAARRVVDLYTDCVRPFTEWPLSSYGIKSIAKSQGFSWVAEDASGASSIAWFDEYRRTGDRAVKERIIDYNRSDCIASAVVLDALIALPVYLAV